MLASLKAAVRRDASFDLPANYATGSGDTYFSGKQVAKLARIGLIAAALADLEHDDDKHDKHDKHDGSDSEEMDGVAAAIEGRLRGHLATWLQGSDRNPMLFDAPPLPSSGGERKQGGNNKEEEQEKEEEEDKAGADVGAAAGGGWGGVVSCGCDYDEGTGGCRNAYPDCPALGSWGLNFGNGWYNDHHFHYGYFVHGMAALVALSDRRAGRERGPTDESSSSSFLGRDPSDALLHRRALLLIRDFANPSRGDAAFPVARHKVSRSRSRSSSSSSSSSSMIVVVVVVIAVVAG